MATVLVASLLLGGWTLQLAPVPTSTAADDKPSVVQAAAPQPPGASFFNLTTTQITKVTARDCDFELSLPAMTAGAEIHVQPPQSLDLFCGTELTVEFKGGKSWTQTIHASVKPHDGIIVWIFLTGVVVTSIDGKLRSAAWSQ